MELKIIHMKCTRTKYIYIYIYFFFFTCNGDWLDILRENCSNEFEKLSLNRRPDPSSASMYVFFTLCFFLYLMKQSPFVLYLRDFLFVKLYCCCSCWVNEKEDGTLLGYSCNKVLGEIFKGLFLSLSLSLSLCGCGGLLNWGKQVACME